MKQGNTSLRSALFLGLIACLIYGLGAGLRASIGILLEPIADMTGLSYEEVSFPLPSCRLSLARPSLYLGS